jgi:hypothetical protein
VNTDDHNARMNAAALAAWQKAHPPAPGEESMPNVQQLLASKFISKGDIPLPTIFTIARLAPTTFRGRGGTEPEVRWVMYFQGYTKGLRLNKTAIKTLAASFGDETDLWVGRQVRLYVDPTVQFAGQAVGGVCVQCPKGPAPGGPPPGARFDPMTGQPLAPTTAPAAPTARFDPMTGKPLAVDRQAAVNTNGGWPGTGQQVDASTGEISGVPQPPVGREEEFDDDIPF